MCLYMKSPILMSVPRDKSVILNGHRLPLKERAKCGGDFYGIDKQTRCDECLGTRKNVFIEVG
jgi:hypothetical protein